MQQYQYRNTVQSHYQPFLQQQPQPQPQPKLNFTTLLQQSNQIVSLSPRRLKGNFQRELNTTPMNQLISNYPSKNQSRSASHPHSQRHHMMVEHRKQVLQQQKRRQRGKGHGLSMIHNSNGYDGVNEQEGEYAYDLDWINSYQPKPLIEKAFAKVQSYSDGQIQVIFPGQGGHLKQNMENHPVERGRKKLTVTKKPSEIRLKQ